MRTSSLATEAVQSIRRNKLRTLEGKPLRVDTGDAGFFEEGSGHLRILDRAKDGATFLLNSPYGPDEVWAHLPSKVQQQIVDKGIELWVIDAFAVAGEVGMGNRINTVMQPCFFKLSGVLPEEEAIAQIKKFVEKTYGKRGEKVVQRNYAAIDLSLERLHKVETGPAPASVEIAAIVPDEARTFGMESLFRQVGIYSHVGQRYEPVDKESLLYYKEAKDGQILEEGISEAGSMSSFNRVTSASSDMPSGGLIMTL